MLSLFFPFALISSHCFSFPFFFTLICFFFFPLISSFLLRSLTILFRLHLVSFVLIFSSLLLSSHLFFALSSSHLILFSFLLYSHLFFSPFLLSHPFFFALLLSSSDFILSLLCWSSHLFTFDHVLVFSRHICFLYFPHLFFSSSLSCCFVSSHLTSCTLLLCSHLVSLLIWVTVSLNMKSAVAPLAPLLVHAGIDHLDVSSSTVPRVLRLLTQRFLRSDSSHAVRNDSWLLDDGNSAKPLRHRLKWLIFAGQMVSMWSLACGAVELDWAVSLQIVKSLEIYSDPAAVMFAHGVKRFPSVLPILFTVTWLFLCCFFLVLGN